MPKAKPRRRGGKPVANWTAIRAEYIAGEESFSEIAARLHVRKSTVESHALNRQANDGRTWGEMRSLHRNEIAAAALIKAGKNHAAKIQTLIEGQANAGLLAQAQMVQRLIEGTATDQDRRFCIRFARDPRLQITGADDGPIDLDLVGALPDDPEIRDAFRNLLKVAARAKPRPANIIQPN